MLCSKGCLIDKTIEQLKKHEGFVGVVYRCPANKLTIGYGRNLQAKGLSFFEQELILGKANMGRKQVIDELLKRKISKKQAEILLKNDVMDCVRLLEQHEWFRIQDEARQGALINMCFNLGYNGLLKFKRMIKALENKDYIIASKEASNSKWYRQVGRRGQQITQQILVGKWQ